MVIRESAEDYLEAILIIGKEKGEVRSIDVAKYLGITKPSVSVAMKNLRSSIIKSLDNAETTLNSTAEVSWSPKSPMPLSSSTHVPRRRPKDDKQECSLPQNDDAYEDSQPSASDNAPY